jgi:hypothetical protein
MSDVNAKKLHEIAVHEAGHTVVALALGATVRWVRVLITGGRTTYEGIDDPEIKGIIATGGLPHRSGGRSAIVPRFMRVCGCVGLATGRYQLAMTMSRWPSMLTHLAKLRAARRSIG